MVPKYFVMRTGVINPKEPIQIHDYGDTLFHLAARRGYLAICNFFVENLQDKNPVNNTGYTPLHRAARGGHLNICKLIIENVQNKNPESNDENTPLHAAAESGHLDICKLILESLQKENLGSIQPTFAVDGQICKLNIVNPMNRFGYTPVYMAERFGHYKICEYINSVVKKETLGVKD